MSSNWDSTFKEYSGDKKKKLINDLGVIRLLRITRQRRDARILELFCGKGECQELLQKQGFANVYGIDISKELLDCSGECAKIQLCDSLNICYKSDNFDLVFINEGLHHLKGLSEIKRCFKEARRVLKPGGILAFYEPADTWARRVAEAMVLSPLSVISKRTRLLKLILLEEMQEYKIWLTHIPQILDLLYSTGYSIERRNKTPIHMAIVARAKKD